MIYLFLLEFVFFARIFLVVGNINLVNVLVMGSQQQAGGGGRDLASRLIQVGSIVLVPSACFFGFSNFDYQFNSWGFRGPEYEEYIGKPVIL